MSEGRTLYSSLCVKETGKALYFLLSAGSRRLKLSTLKRNSLFIHVRGELFPQACTKGVLAEWNKISMSWRRFQGGRSLFSIRKTQYLVTHALVLSRRNAWTHAQTSIFEIENQCFLVQMAPQTCQLRAWKPGIPSKDSSARCPQPEFLSRSPQPGFLSQESQQRFLSQESPAKSVWGPRWSHILCLLSFVVQWLLITRFGSCAGVIC